jgi:hypothetical protein
MRGMGPCAPDRPRPVRRPVRPDIRIARPVREYRDPFGVPYEPDGQVLSYRVSACPDTAFQLAIRRPSCASVRLVRLVEAQKELEDLFERQNRSEVKGATSIPATFLKATVAV